MVEQGGRIRLLKNDALVGRAFLDVSGKIDHSGERGLLSIAFHPQYATNGRFYVYLNNKNGAIRIVRYNVSSDPDVADVTPLTDHAMSVLGKKIGTTRVSLYAEGKRLGLPGANQWPQYTRSPKE